MGKNPSLRLNHSFGCILIAFCTAAHNGHTSNYHNNLMRHLIPCHTLESKSRTAWQSHLSNNFITQSIKVATRLAAQQLRHLAKTAADQNKEANKNIEKSKKKIYMYINVCAMAGTVSGKLLAWKREKLHDVTRPFTSFPTAEHMWESSHMKVRESERMCRGERVG